MPSIIRQGASVTATVLEVAAGMLRRLAANDRREQTESRPQPAPAGATAVKPAAAKPKPKAAAPKPSRPAPTTRTDIADPKNARKVRARQG